VTCDMWDRRHSLGVSEHRKLIGCSVGTCPSVPSSRWPSHCVVSGMMQKLRLVFVWRLLKSLNIGWSPSGVFDEGCYLCSHPSPFLSVISYIV